MERIVSDSESRVFHFGPEIFEEEEEESETLQFADYDDDDDDVDVEISMINHEEDEEEREESSSRKHKKKTNKKKKKKKKKQVLLEGYVETTAEDDESTVSRTKSLTDEDLDELKGCLDLGFGFSYDEIPELCNTLPALELCYSMSQKFMDDQQQHLKSPESSSSPPPTAEIANWKISSPGDHPEDVKARLKYWAQAVACTIRLCS